MHRSLVLAALVLALASPASADAIGGCPEGQIWQGNPTTPGAMHHGGGQCVPDPSASHGCAVGLGGSHAAASLVGAAALTILRRRRDKVRAR
jgi:hypothetical protein